MRIHGPDSLAGVWVNVAELLTLIEVRWATSGPSTGQATNNSRRAALIDLRDELAELLELEDV
jgi:hypothetical protein